MYGNQQVDFGNTSMDSLIQNYFGSVMPQILMDLLVSMCRFVLSNDTSFFGLIQRYVEENHTNI